MRVLLVEDEPYMADAIRDGLRLEAIAADIAGDGDTALELLSVNAYDIAVLDRDIPGPTGDEIAERIVASGSGMPILMLTAADRLDVEATRARDRRPAAGSVPPRGLPRRPLRRADEEAVRSARGPRRCRRRYRQRRRTPSASMGRERRPVHQRRAHYGVGTAQTTRRTVDHRDRARRRLPRR